MAQRIGRILISVVLLQYSAISLAQEAIDGRVSRVDGKAIVIEAESAANVKQGDKVNVFVIIPGLDERADVADAKVTRKDSVGVHAEIVRSSGTVKVGHRVTILATGRPAPTDPLVIPNLVGMTATEAKTALEELGLQATFVAGPPARTPDKSFTIQSQDPTAGAPVSGVQSVQVTILAEAVSRPPQMRLASSLDIPTEEDRRSIREIVRLLEEQHVSGRMFDDEASREALRLFLENLDPWKIYFLKSDVDQFSRLGDKIDDTTKQGDLRLPYAIFESFLRRLDERTEMVRELVSQGFDFTIDEQLSTDNKSISYAATRNEVRDRLRKRLKFELLKMSRGEMPLPVYEELLVKRFETFRQGMYAVNGEELLQRFASAICKAFDPNCHYSSPAFSRLARRATTKKQSQPGFRLRALDGAIFVRSIDSKESTGGKSRLSVGDRIIGIGEGADGPIEAVDGLSGFAILERLYGNEGTPVQIQVLPASGGPPIVHMVNRTRNEQDNATVRAVVVEHRVGQGDPFPIGYLEIPTFYTDSSNPEESASGDFSRIIKEFQRQSVAIIVVDLRRNFGSSSVEILNVLGYFLPGQSVVALSHGRDRAVITETSIVQSDAWDGPLVVLTSRQTSAAAEVFAAAIQDHSRGLIIGDDVTRGQGAIRDYVDLGRQLKSGVAALDLGSVTITAGLAYRVSGAALQGRGVAADVVLPTLSSVMTETMAPMALPYSDANIGDAKINPSRDKITQKLRDELHKKSLARRQNSSGFARLQNEIEQYRYWHSKNTVSLLSRTTASDSSLRKTPPTSGIDFYLEEVYSIASDYLSHVELNRANENYASKQYSDAIEQYQLSVAADPDHAEARYRLAWALATCPQQNVRDGALAVDHARRATELAPDDWRFRFALSIGLAENGDFESALEELDRTLQAAPEKQRTSYEYLRERFQNSQPFASR